MTGVSARPVRRLPELGLDQSDLGTRSLRISIHRDRDPVGTVAIALSGELDLASADGLEAALREAEETDIGWIVVDLSDVSFVDSTGLNVLLQAKMRSDGRLSYVPSQHDAVTRLLELTGTTQMLGSA